MFDFSDNNEIINRNQFLDETFMFNANMISID